MPIYAVFHFAGIVRLFLNQSVSLNLRLLFEPVTVSVLPSLQLTVISPFNKVNELLELPDLKEGIYKASVYGAILLINS